MGIIIREFRCNDCGGTFESADPVEEVACPTCSAPEPERVFLTPPAIRDARTSGTDRDLKNLANDYGLTNMSNRHGEAVKKAPDGASAPQFSAADNPQAAQVLSRLGGNGDGFSGVLPSLRAAGRPHQWAKQPLKR